MKMNTKTILPVVALAGLALATGSANAAIMATDVIVVDLGKTGQLTTSTAIANWNNVARDNPGSNVFTNPDVIISDAIRYSDGGATGVTMTSAGTSGIGGLVITSAGAAASFTSTGVIPDSAQIDVSFASSSASAFTFANLNSSLTYNLEIMSLVDSGTARNANDITVNGTTISIDPNDSPGIYAFNDISVNGSNEIVISFGTNSGAANAQHINALELTAVSEPSSELELTGFTYDPSTGASEVNIKGSPGTRYELVEDSDLDFSTPDQNPVPLTGVTLGTQDGNGVITDSFGNATVQFNLGTANDATFIRAESAP